MLKIRGILFLWTIFVCCQAARAASSDDFFLRNNTPDEQKVSLLFQSRVLLRNNENLLAPPGFSFVEASGRRTSLLNPGFPDFAKFQRENFEVAVEVEVIIPAGTEQKITPPYPLIRTVSISNPGHDPISFDWEELYYGGVSTQDDWLEIKREHTLSTVLTHVVNQFKFSRDHNVPNPDHERTKPPPLRCPAPLIRQVYGKSAEDALQGINFLEVSSLEILRAVSETTASASEFMIPRRSHRMWITDPVCPVEPPLTQLDYYINSLAMLNLKEGWTHKFWCWDKRHLPRTCAILENCGQGVEIVEFCQPAQLERIIAPHFVFAAIDHGLFTLAGNILRQNVLFHEGGFYTDIGAEFKQDPSRLLLCSDVIAHHRIGRSDPTAWFIDHDFMAARPGNFVSRDFLDRINSLHELANNPEIIEFFQHPRLVHSWTNARLLTEIFSLFGESYGARILILPNDEAIIAAHHQTSWFGGDGKSCRDIDKTTLNWFKVTPDYEDLKRSLTEDGFNFDLYKKYFAQALRTPGELIHHFLSQSPGVSIFEPSAAQPLPVTVTLTSWPGKIRDAHIAIASLLNQNFKSNKVVLWLAEEEFPGQKIPSTLLQLLARGLDVRWCENIRSAKKLIPSLRDPELREMLLVTADDDIIYRPDWLESLVIVHREYPKDIIAHRTRVMQLGEDHKPTPYKKWRLLRDSSIAVGKILFPTSGGGVLFPPHSLHPEALKADRFMELCPTGDDIFWFAMVVLQGTKIRIPSNPQVDIIDINDDEAKKVSLWETNRLGENDVMIEAVFGAYDIYRRLGKM